jgi:hypothetical protein
MHEKWAYVAKEKEDDAGLVDLYNLNFDEYTTSTI